MVNPVVLGNGRTMFSGHPKKAESEGDKVTSLRQRECLAVLPADCLREHNDGSCKILQQSGLVHTKKVGRIRTCRIENTGLTVAERWISDRRSLWEKRLDRLGHLLTEPDEK